MRKRFIACLAVFAMIATMVPGVAMAAVKDEVNQAQTVDVSAEGDVVATVYYGSAENGKVNVIVTGKVGAINPIGANTDGWDYYKNGENWYQWNKVYDVNADETVTFADSSSFDKGTNSFTVTQDVKINFHKFDTEDPVIDPEGTVADVTEVEVGADYEIPALPVTDDITADFTTNDCTVYYSATNEDGTWTTVDSVDTSKEGWYNIWYTAKDDSGKEASARRTVHVVDTTAPTITIEPVADMEKGDILNIADVKATAEDNGSVKEVWLNEILYSATNESWEDYESVWKLNKGEDAITDFEMAQPGYYKLKYRATDNAVDTNTGYASIIIKVDEIYGTAGFTINYVDKDGKAVGEPTVIEKENAVLSYGYDEDGNKITFYDFAYEQDGYVLNVPEGYYVADEKDFNGLTDPVTVFVENGGENTADEYDVIVTAVEKDAPAADEELTPPAPKTGDDMNMGLLAGLAALMVMAGTGAIVVGRKVFNK